MSVPELNTYTARVLPEGKPLTVSLPFPPGGVPPETVTVAVPDLEVSTVDVALMVRVVAVSLAATVSTPSVFILVSVLLFPLTVQVTVWAGLPVPVTAAVKVRVPPFATLTAEGLTATPVTVGAAAFTVTLKVAVLPP
jgi:hypothetical protein